MYLDKVKTHFKQLDLVSSGELIPCSPEEIRALEEQLGLSLPGAYKEFLLWMGHNAGSFLRGSDCFYQDLRHLREWAIELLEENDFSETLPNDAFVFFMHQGYQFAFLRTCEGDDPPVYYYHEGMDQTSFIRAYRSFSEFLSNEIDAHAEYAARLGNG